MFVLDPVQTLPIVSEVHTVWSSGKRHSCRTQFKPFVLCLKRMLPLAIEGTFSLREAAKGNSNRVYCLGSFLYSPDQQLERWLFMPGAGDFLSVSLGGR